ncbi:E3 ubiquitin-protein ligase TRIM65-like [Paramisgurnus dabryanus]|uniref:E3 ubiquitin-protein ligase TRIM65-like n=1 Tax=Paramisgurnus dabryanus TaxID=90735 RepID=UPI003CCF3951
MAEASISVVPDRFICSICLDLLKDPVTIPCGHSYCMSCITDCWNQKRNYSCPQCRQTFTTRPDLGKNTMLDEVVEKLKKTKLQPAATGRLQQMICPQHEKLLEIYCKTDQLCICYLCMVGKHKNHNTIPAKEERTKKQKELKKTQRKYQQRIQESQKKLQELRDAVETHKRSAKTAVDDTERIRSIERRRSEVTQLIRDQEKTAVSEAEGLLKRLEQEIDDLRRRDAELEKLLHTDDHIHFLQVTEIRSLPRPKRKPWIRGSELVSVDDCYIYIHPTVTHISFPHMWVVWQLSTLFGREEREAIGPLEQYITWGDTLVSPTHLGDTICGRVRPNVQQPWPVPPSALLVQSQEVLRLQLPAQGRTRIPPGRPKLPAQCTYLITFWTLKLRASVPLTCQGRQLKSFQSLSVPPGSSDSLSITVSSLISFDDVGKSVSHLREKLEDFCKEEIEKIFDKSKALAPETREQFLKYYHHFTADPNTAYKHLCLYEGNKVITKTNTAQPYPHHPDRFTGYPQVLCSESLSGRCYWEVEWRGNVDISVSYKSISRKGEGDECLFGFNDQSWSLCCCNSRYLFRHNKIVTKLPVVSRSSRIGVYVDHSSGSLSFYSVSDTMTLIHRVNTTFTKPLYPGFYVDLGSVKLCDITI